MINYQVKTEDGTLTYGFEGDTVQVTVEPGTGNDRRSVSMKMSKMEYREHLRHLRKLEQA